MNGQQRKGVPPLVRGLIVIAVGLIIWFSPVPTGVKKEAWHLLAIFVATIIGLILTPLPQGAMVIIGVMVTGFTQTLNVGMVLSGFANSTVWLIVSAFLLTRAFIKTGLGRRIAYLFIRTFGRKTLGLSYAIAASDLVLAPATPSNTARSGGIIYPIVRGMASTFGSEPGESARKIGSFLMMAEYQVVVHHHLHVHDRRGGQPFAHRAGQKDGQHLRLLGYVGAGRTRSRPSFPDPRPSHPL